MIVHNDKRRANLTPDFGRVCPRRGEGRQNEETVVVCILPRGVNRGGQSAVQVRNGTNVYRVAHYMQ